MTNSILKFLKSRLRLILLVIVALAWSEFGLRVFLPVFQAPHWPNPAYWVAARLAAEGNANLIYADRDVFFQQSARLGTVPDIFEANMPTTILVFLPLQAFSETAAYIIWDVMMIVCYILACALLFRTLALPPMITLALWALVPLFRPWRENIGRGQAYPLLLLLLVVGAILGFRYQIARAGPVSGRAGWSQLGAGFAFGLIAVVKLYYAAVLLLPALIWHRGRTLVAAAALFAVAALITTVLWGAGLWNGPIQYAITWRDRPESAVTAYQTLNSLLTHLLRYDSTWNKGPVADLPQLVGWLWWAGVIAILATTCAILWVAQRNYRSQITDYGLETNTRLVESMLPLALVVPVALLLAPVAEDYHFVLTIFPLVVGGKVLWDMNTEHRVRNGARIPCTGYLVLATLLFVSALLLGAPWRFNVSSIGGWHSLLYYPRLYGSLLLWVLIMALIIAVRRSPAAPSRDTSAP